MKNARLLAYAAAGVIAGLLIENMALRTKQKLGKKARDVKKDAGRRMDNLKAEMH